MPDTYNDLPAQNPVDFGELVARERKALGKTQQQLGDEVGVNRKTIRELESGGNVRMHTVFAVLAALGHGIRVETIRPSYEQLKGFMDNE